MLYLYGPQSQVMNVHNLLHVTDDLMNFNCSLSRISCFPFKNTLGEIKCILLTANKPLAQVCRRLHAQNVVAVDKYTRVIDNKIFKKIVHDNKICIKKMLWNGLTITTKRQDNMILLKNDIIMDIFSMYTDKHNTSLSGVIIKGKNLEESKINIQISMQIAFVKYVASSNKIPCYCYIFDSICVK